MEIIVEPKKKGKIYAIRTLRSPLFYIGSTKQHYLSNRLRQHHDNYIKYQHLSMGYLTSFEILKYEDAYIELIELFEYDDISQLRKREGFYINLHRENIVNKNIAGRSKVQYNLDTRHIEYPRRNQKSTCLCGSITSLRNKSHHIKSKKHKNYITTPIPPSEQQPEPQPEPNII